MTDTRSSALFKRAEQLKRWEESDTNRQSASPKRASKIKFSSGCVFLAACTAGDKEEVLRLLKLGADINTANVDGLTALHQACIDDNLDMVEFLVSRGADVDRGDNEGWTPLHATASCGFISIARFLLESGANVAAVNYDGELPVDIAESDKMEEILQKVINEKGVDCDAARNAEVNSLLADAKKWVATGYIDMQDPKTGGTPLHVAAAKGYLDVATVLLEECGVDPDCVDFDGWTPLHAAALWGQKEAAAALIKHGADMDIKNYSGQTCVDLVEPSIASWLEEARSAAGSRLNNNNNNKHKRWPAAPLNPPSSKVKRVELQITNHNDNTTNENKKNTPAEIIPKLSDGKPPKGRAPSPTSEPSSDAPPTENNASSGDEPPSWRRSASLRTRLNNEANRDVKSNSTNNAPADDTVLRRTHSFENDKTFYQRYCDVTARIKASSCPSIPPPPQSMSAIERLQLRKKSHLTQEPNTADTNEEVERRVNSAERRERDANTWAAPAPATTTAHTTVRSSAESLDSQNSNSTSQSSTPPSATPTKLSPGNIFKNFFKSFVPPVRDEESETQRKAHAKRVRETRRSTQGVTLDEIKSAEQLVKKKPNNGVTSDAPAPAPEHPAPSRNADTASQAAAPAAATPFELEDASATPPPAAAPSPRPASPRLPPPHAVAADTTVTLPLPRSAAANAATTTALTTTPALPSTKNEKGEEEKEKDSGGAERGVAASTQAALNVIQRRRRPKRRSTGVGNLEIDDIVNDRGGGGEVDSEGDASQSGSERTSEAGEAPPPVREAAAPPPPRAEAAPEREPDYRALWEASQKEVSRLRDLLTTSERQLRESRGTIARLTQVNQNSLTELEKREKRAMERKLSEMEEELKGHQALQAENQRLKDENGALIRVISKLSK